MLRRAITIDRVARHIRLRNIDNMNVEATFKGPRFYSVDNASSRLEFEVPTTSMEAATTALRARGLRRTWYLEKKRTEFANAETGVRVAIDELPKIGFFVELEGNLTAIRQLVARSITSLGAVERRNYKELALEEIGSGNPQVNLEGLSF